MQKSSGQQMEGCCSKTPSRLREIPTGFSISSEAIAQAVLNLTLAGSALEQGIHTQEQTYHQ